MLVIQDGQALGEHLGIGREHGGGVTLRVVPNHGVCLAQQVVHLRSKDLKLGLVVFAELQRPLDVGQVERAEAALLDDDLVEPPGLFRLEKIVQALARNSW